MQAFMAIHGSTKTAISISIPMVLTIGTFWLLRWLGVEHSHSVSADVATYASGVCIGVGPTWLILNTLYNNLALQAAENYVALAFAKAEIEELKESGSVINAKALQAEIKLWKWRAYTALEASKEANNKGEPDPNLT